MNSEIKAIILDLGNYASNDKPQTNEHNVIIPYSLHYIDANLLFDYICELEEENKELKNLPFIQYQKAILKITEVLDTKSVFIRKKKIKRILEEYYYGNN